MESELGNNSLGSILDSLVFSINNILNLSARIFCNQFVNGHFCTNIILDSYIINLYIIFYIFVYTFLNYVYIFKKKIKAFRLVAKFIFIINKNINIKMYTS